MTTEPTTPASIIPWTNVNPADGTATITLNVRQLLDITLALATYQSGLGDIRQAAIGTLVDDLSEITMVLEAEMADAAADHATDCPRKGWADDATLAHHCTCWKHNAVADQDASATQFGPVPAGRQTLTCEAETNPIHRTLCNDMAASWAILTDDEEEIAWQAPVCQPHAEMIATAVNTATDLTGCRVDLHDLTGDGGVIEPVHTDQD